MAELKNKFIVRIGSEVSLKGRAARTRFVNAIKNHLKFALESRGASCQISHGASCLFLETDNSDETAALLPHIFGIGSYSLVEAESSTELEDIVATGAKHFSDVVRGKEFAVRARRAGAHRYNSMDIERQLGAELGKHAKVNLRNPEITVFVDVHNNDQSRFHTKRYKGAGGLPFGVEGRAMVLVSGGFDSIVAAWRILRRGVELDFLFCNLGGKAYERLVLQIVKVFCELWAHKMRSRFYVVDFTKLTAELKKSTAPIAQQVLLKRYMYRVAEYLGLRAGAQAIVTGEAIGQVSSQTLANLAAIDRVLDQMMILRPLIGLDKDEIIQEARHIGTASLSEQVKEYCSISTGRPMISGNLTKIMTEEEKIDPSVFEEALQTIRQINIQDVSGDDLRAPYLFKEDFPEGCVTIDCQLGQHYSLWHAPQSKHYDINHLMKTYKQLDKDQTYVIYCTFGTQSPFVAEIMQQSGYEAYAFKGGISKVKSYFKNQ